MLWPMTQFSSDTPCIALVGRPNVGKSTLFNRLVGRRLAITGSTPGLTRDWRHEQFYINERPFSIIDTAGIEHHDDKQAISHRMRAQSESIVQRAQLCLLLIDGAKGVVPEDEKIATYLRKNNAQVVVVVNKSEVKQAEQTGYEAFALGYGEPIFVSAEHGEGLPMLKHYILKFFAQEEPEATDDEELAAEEAAPLDDEEYHANKPVRIAIIGRPNAGKSTLVNTLLGEDRVLTGPEAGITRDAVAVPMKVGTRDILLYDTAGMRKKARIHHHDEVASVDDTLRALRFADTVILLSDAIESFDKQDLQIADLVEREGRGLVIGLNKWDKVDTQETSLQKVRDHCDKMLPQWRGVPVLPCSAVSGYGTQALLNAALQQEHLRNKRIGTGPLNRVLAQLVSSNLPPAVGGQRLRLRYMTQIKSRPPTFALFVSRPDELPASYIRYISHGLREAFKLTGVPVRILLRASHKENPYV